MALDVGMCKYLKILSPSQPVTLGDGLIKNHVRTFNPSVLHNLSQFLPERSILLPFLSSCSSPFLSLTAISWILYQEISPRSIYNTDTVW